MISCLWPMMNIPQIFSFIMQSLRRIHLCNPACREPDTEPDHTGQQQTTASESDKKTPPGVSQSVCVRQIEIEHIEYKHQNHRNRKDQQEKTFHVQKTFQCIRGNTKSKTNYTYDIDIQQIKEDRKKYEKSQCFPFASHFGLKRG